MGMVRRIRTWLRSLRTRQRFDLLLKERHPSLWRAFVLDIVVMAGAGVGYFFFRTPRSFTDIPAEGLGIGFLLAASVLLFGFRYSYDVFSKGLWVSMGLCGFLSTAILGQIIQGYISDTTAPALGSFFFFLFCTLQLWIQAGEPLANPTSEAMHNGSG